MTTPRIPFGRAHLLATSAIHEAVRAGIPAPALTAAGRVRRFAPEVDDTALVAGLAASHHADALARFATLPMVTSVLARSASMVRVATDRGRATFHVATPAQLGAALVWHTGSRRHTRALSARAERRGLVFRDGLLRRLDGAPLDAPAEEDLYRHLGLPCIPPELREGDGELDAAERNGLPRLVTSSQIRGDLHMHTTWSDGRDTVDAMIQAASRLGYEYVAITDHSERAGCSRTLSAADIPVQREEIARAQERVPGIGVLHGAEVDILPDGSLDFDDERLARFDIVLASLHDHAGQDGRQLTERYLRAIHHPLVNVITHPANRTPGRSAGYDLDYERLFAAAAETGTALEIDGAPGHLDMDGRVARAAVTAGVTVSIDSDCHRADALGRQMLFGVGTARRGWVEARHVLNTRSLDAVRAFVSSKRGRR